MLFALVSAVCLAQDPYAALLATSATSPADEYAIGKEYIDSQLWLFGSYDNPEQQRRVERITRRVLAASDRPDLIFNVKLLADEEVNASALPGGFLQVNKGLLDLVDDNELAFVIGHELSHVILRHGASTMNLQAATHSVTDLQATRTAEDRAAARKKATELYLMMASHSRQLELEADLYGQLYAVRAGYPSAASVTALQDLEASIGVNLSPAEVPWASHPLFAERIDQLQKGFGSLQRTHAQFDAGLTWLRAGRYEQAATSFQQFLTVFPRSTAAWANLGAAHLYQAAAGADDPWLDVLPLHSESGISVRGTNPAVARDRARDALLHAVEIDKNDPVSVGLLGVLARGEGRLSSARLLLERALLTSEDAAPLLVVLGNVAAGEGKYDEAVRHWEKARKLAPEQVEPLVNLARLHEQQKKKKPAIAAWQEVLQVPAWSAEAVTHLKALGVKVDAPAAPPGGAEKLLAAGATFGVGDSLPTVVTALGAPEFDMPGDDTGDYHYLAWYAHGLEALVLRDRVLQWGVGAPSSVKTNAGITIGSTEADLTAAYGEPSDQFTLGAIEAYTWSARGLSAVIADGEVISLGLNAVP
ncbi:MAG: M48 family metalloprotease [Pseudomonadota bacterium]|nr:M48 family metalloprotease [Pseudomonadota bacterium]